MRHKKTVTASGGIFAATQTVQHGHRFGSGSRLVQQGRVGDFHAGQINDHGLEIQQCLQATLGNFRLIRRIGGVPARIFQHVALDHRRHDGVVIAQANVALIQFIFRRNRAQMLEIGVFGQPFRQIKRLLQANIGRNSLVYQRIQRHCVDLAQHVLNVLFGRAVVAGNK